MSSVFCQVVKSISRMFLLSEIATLLTRISIRLNSSWIAPTVVTICSGFDTSQTNGAAETPLSKRSPTTLSARPWSRSTTAIEAPSSASRWAIASPIFLPAPVMIASFPSLPISDFPNARRPTWLIVTIPYKPKVGQRYWWSRWPKIVVYIHDPAAKAWSIFLSGHS